MAPILPIPSSIPPLRALSIADVSGVATARGAEFQSAFDAAVQQVEGFSQSASVSINRFLSGDSGELHDVALKTRQAELSLDLFLQIRNQIVSAYQEVMKMQI
jgi:flagellar hook-basal body complex protein FliE